MEGMRAFVPCPTLHTVTPKPAPHLKGARPDPPHVSRRKFSFVPRSSPQGRHPGLQCSHMVLIQYG